MSESKRHYQTNVTIKDKPQHSVATHLRYGKIFNSHIFTSLLLSVLVKKFKLVNIWQNCRQEGGLHFDDCEQKQFPVMLMTQMQIIDYSVGCGVWTVKIFLSVN